MPCILWEKLREYMEIPSPRWLNLNLTYIALQLG